MTGTYRQQGGSAQEITGAMAGKHWRAEAKGQVPERKPTETETKTET